VLSWVVREDRLIWLCPTATPQERREALAECVDSILRDGTGAAFDA
jgi:hypothetical protein